MPVLQYGTPVQPGETPIDRSMIKKFREQMLALGVLWVLIGGLAAIFVFYLNARRGATIGGFGTAEGMIIGVVGALSAVWMVLGVMTCLKQMWAVYVGLVLSYLNAIGSVLQINLCAVGIMIAAILQAHRVIGWARRMRQAGVPLNAKP
jgi:hypothetical protein